ncbi:TIGR01777 family oxidoreductase [Microbacterium betulae]|uniref:TIGR01777 family oxidoreductase n=1 Tax=Microbacterium betulae TaxID=2981139 RepID=A0AA97I4R4_9MICO|nr:TIGR01777 family oxidoreductase [Microbacterium sp. AB]WOF22034.1 TIGR01777 family oxidoreductase [Microbacterium sp. AB]
MTGSTLSRVVVAGSSGLIGRALVDDLRASGVDVTRLVRRAPSAPDEVRWLDAPSIDPAVLAGADAVVNLCGASVGRLPWTPGYRRELRASRLTPTRVLARAIRQLEEPPLFVSASAAGIYGSAPGRRLAEDAGPGDGFLAELCRDWEEAAREAGDRVASLRTAPVVHPGAVLKPLIPLARLGAAGPLGPGDQVWAWISLDDAVGAVRHVLEHRLTGPVNLAGPAPVTASGFVRALARRLRRPFWLPAPAWGVRALLGRDFADAMLLSDADVVPAVLQGSGYAFAQKSVETAIAAVVPAP